MSNQIETQIDVTLTERNRLTALFRGFLILPMAIYLFTFTTSYDNFTFAWVFIGSGLFLPVLYAMVFRQKYPSYVLTLNEGLISLRTRFLAYAMYLTDEYPSIEENEIVSVTIPQFDPKNLSRWLPLVKWLLAAPLYLVGIIYIFYSYILTVIGWFSILFRGAYPEFCAEGVVGTIAFWNRVTGYAFMLVTDEYPRFSL